MKLKRLLRMALFPVASILIATGCSKPNPPAESKPPIVETKPKPLLLEAESQPPILIEPLGRVDKVRKGMNQQEVEAALGQPDKKNDNTLFYLKQGIFVMIGKNGIVFNVQCYKPFAGVTKEGIGIGSSRADLIKAYGPPDQDQHFAEGEENLWFAPLRTSFYLKDDKVSSFIVHW